MNDPMKKLDELAARARKERAPETDVSRRVMASVRSLSMEDTYRPLKWFALASAAAAAAVAVAYIPLYQAMADPLVAALADLTWGLL